jgi:hypothetical protein
MSAIAHVAGPMKDSLQQCARCGAVLADYRNAVVDLRCARLPRGWRRGAVIVVVGNGLASWIVEGEDDSPPCAPRAESRK